MKFQINVRGEFNNIMGLDIAQSYYTHVKCGACGGMHKKDVFVSDKTKKRVRVRDVVGKVEVYNLTVECRNCRNMMCIKISEPENRTRVELGDELEDAREMWIFPVVDNAYCHISTIQSDSGIITDVDGLILDAVSMDGSVFSNVEFSKRILAEDDFKGKTIDIQKFEIEVKQVS